jgi:hypothetical protein
MDERWYQHLASRKRQGIDVVQRWQERSGAARPAPAEAPEDGPKWFDKPRPA